MDSNESVFKSGATNQVPFFKLVSLCDGCELVAMYLGWMCAFTAGIGMPATFSYFADAVEVLIGDTIDD
jgi:hypothetical protein